MNQKFMAFFYSDSVRIEEYSDAHFTEEELRSGQYISVSEFNDCQRENDKECYNRVAGLNDQIVPQEEVAYRLLTKHFDSSILNHMDVRKHLVNKLFNLGFEVIDELYCHANSYDLVKATSEIQNIKMRPSENLIKFFNQFEDALRNYVLLHGKTVVKTKVTMVLGTKFMYPSRAFVENKNEECMCIYNQAVLSDSLKETYFKNAVSDIPEYTFALATDSGTKSSASSSSKPT
jgi:hypothetical protein